MKFKLKYAPIAENGPRFASDIVMAADSIRDEGVPLEAVAGTLFGFGAYLGQVMVSQGSMCWVDFDDEARAKFGHAFGVAASDGRHMLSVAELEAVIPAMRPWRVGPRPIDWATLEGQLGTSLPSDYRALAEAYPTLQFQDFLRVPLPNPGAESVFASGFEHEAEILRDLWQADLTEGYAPYPEPGGLLCWGTSLDGDSFYWKTGSPNPDEWPVVVFGCNDDWSEFPGGVVKFLADTYSRAIHIPGMPGNFPSDSPEVKGLGG